MKYIKNYETLYSIDIQGRLFSHVSDKYLTPRRDKYGYLLINLYKDKISSTFKVHRLVAETFIPNPENKLQVNHINGIKSDNRVENLEWATHSQNQRHAYSLGLNYISEYQKSQTSKINKKKLKVDQYWIHPEYGTFVGGQRELSRLFNRPNQGNLAKLVRGQVRSVKGWTLIDP